MDGGQKQFFRTVLVLAIVISAVVGGVFGYYAPQVGKSLPSLNLPYSSLGEEGDVITLVKSSSPAVVSIAVNQAVTLQSQSPFSEFYNDPFFRQFFPDMIPQQPQTRTEERQVAAGTGFIISSDGMIITNKHVVDFQGDKTEFVVTMNDGRKHAATVLATDPFLDVAILKVEASNLPTLELGDSSTLEIGQTVVAIGNALGEFSNTVSKGVISGLSRSIIAQSGSSSERLSQVIQTDAAINPGNSGGPLLGLNGKVIGINTAVAQGAQNIGFAIPINQAKKAVNDVRTKGKISYPFLGIRYQLVTSELRREKNLPVDYGAFIIGSAQTPGIIKGSPAEKAGIREGDIILEIDGVKVTQDNDLAQIIQSKETGARIKIKIIRGQEEKLLEAELASLAG